MINLFKRILFGTPKPLRIRLLIGGKVMWDISDSEMRATVALNGGGVHYTAKSKHANQVIDFIVTDHNLEARAKDLNDKVKESNANFLFK